jgi:hypothetical protein
MALGNPTHRGSGYAPASSTPTSASLTVPSGDVIHVCVAARKQTSAFGASDFTVSDTGGHTWTKFFDRQHYDAGSNPRVAIQWFWAISNGSATTITAGHTESVATFVAVESYTIGAGMVPSCTNFGSNGNAAGDPSVTLGATPDSLTISSNIAAAANGVTPPTGYTELVEQTNNGTHEVCYDNTSTWSATVSYTTGNVNMLAVVGEIDEVSSGGGPVTGTLSKTLDDATLAGTGNLAISGSASATLDAVTLAASGGAGVSGTLAATLDAVTLSGSGKVAIAGTLSATLDAVTLAGTGSLSASPGSGSLSATLADVALAGTSRLAIAASLATTLDAVTLATTARLAISGAATATLDAVTLAGSATLTNSASTGSLAVTLDDVTLDTGPRRSRGDDAPGMRWAHSTAGAARRSLYARQIAEVAERLRDLPPKPKKKAAVLDEVAEVLDAVAVSDPYVGRKLAPAIEAIADTLNKRTVATFDPAELAVLLEALAREEAAAHRRWRRRRDEAALLAILFAA